MVRQARPGHPARVAYKLVAELFPHQWDEICMEAQARQISGGELVGAILAQWINSNRNSELPPVPEAPSEDA